MKKYFVFLIAALSLTACDPSGSGSSSTSGNDSNDTAPPVTQNPQPSASATPGATATPKPAATPTPTATPAPHAGFNVEVPPLWEAKRTEGRSWTLHVFDVVDRYGSALQAGASDVQDFCPQFYNLSYEQKLNFWAFLISSITKYESSFNPTSRYVETTMGTDPVTGRQVASEGLMQLSYQDVSGWSFCNEFDWSVDRYLSDTDPRKTIFDPFKNLSCGTRILNNQVSRYGKIAIGSGAYWAVIKTNSTYNKLAEIKALTRSEAYCQ